LHDLVIVPNNVLISLSIAVPKLAELGRGRRGATMQMPREPLYLFNRRREAVP
jgi:hypothetical protein